MKTNSQIEKNTALCIMSIIFFSFYIILFVCGFNSVLCVQECPIQPGSGVEWRLWL